MGWGLNPTSCVVKFVWRWECAGWLLSEQPYLDSTVNKYDYWITLYGVGDSWHTYLHSLPTAVADIPQCVAVHALLGMSILWSYICQIYSKCFDQQYSHNGHVLHLLQVVWPWLYHNLPIHCTTFSLWRTPVTDFTRDDHQYMRRERAAIMTMYMNTNYSACNILLTVHFYIFGGCGVGCGPHADDR